MSTRLAVALCLAALVLMVAWNFVPADVTYQGDIITCWPASVDRSSPPSEVPGHILACRPVATRRELQGFAGLAVALIVIWGSYLRTRQQRNPSGPAPAPSP